MIINAMAGTVLATASLAASAYAWRKAQKNTGNPETRTWMKHASWVLTCVAGITAGTTMTACAEAPLFAATGIAIAAVCLAALIRFESAVTR